MTTPAQKAEAALVRAASDVDNAMSVLLRALRSIETAQAELQAEPTPDNAAPETTPAVDEALVSERPWGDDLTPKIRAGSDQVHVWGKQPTHDCRILSEANFQKRVAEDEAAQATKPEGGAPPRSTSEVIAAWLSLPEAERDHLIAEIDERHARWIAGRAILAERDRARDSLEPRGIIGPLPEVPPGDDS